MATRLFLKRLKRELNIPVMGLVDSDPYGLKILSVYMSGESERIAATLPDQRDSAAGTSFRSQDKTYLWGLRERANRRKIHRQREDR